MSDHQIEQLISSTRSKIIQISKNDEIASLERDIADLEQKLLKGHPNEHKHVELPRTKWEKTLNEIVVPAVTAIKFCKVRSFDTNSASYSVATGFVVDKTKGFILTNRHVVTPSPVTAEAIFLDHEEVDLLPLYRDPVHDFGFYRFNPEHVKFLGKMTQIELAPEKAKVGVEIRVVGNDAGEKLSILSGSLARLDRPAPSYGEGRFNDFNTFYYQAASSTSGGSSGSPVVNIEGQAIAINAGGKKRAASSFYLPLHRVARALKLLQQGLPVPRGTLQTVFVHAHYDELKRLGLDNETEARVRTNSPDATGLLIVEECIPGGPAHEKLQPGDIVLKYSHKDEWMTNFDLLESVLDDHVGKEITLQIRRGDQNLSISFTVQDLHSITPDRFVEIGGAVVQSLGLQLAKSYRLPVTLPVIISAGFMFGKVASARGCIIVSVGDHETSDLQSFVKAVTSFPDKSRVPVRYYHALSRQVVQVVVITISRWCFDDFLWIRNDTTGIWDRQRLPAPPKPDFTPKPGRATPLEPPVPTAAALMSSMVFVQFTTPWILEGGSEDTYVGAGLIIDIEKGLVLTDQNTVPQTLGELTLVFGSMLVLPAKVLFIHPIHNFSVLQFDPSLLIGSEFKSADLDFDAPLPTQESPLLLVGFTNKQNPFAQATNVSKIEEFFVGEVQGSTPKWRATHEEVIHIEKAPASIGGFLIDFKGKIIGCWMSYSTADTSGSPTEVFKGIPIRLLRDVVEPFRRGEVPTVNSFEAEFWPIQLAYGRELGLPDEWVEKIAAHSKKKQLLYLRRLFANSPAEGIMKAGDVLLAIDGKLICNFEELEKTTKSLTDAAELTIFRKQLMVVKVKPIVLHSHGTKKCAIWAGALLADPHRGMLQSGKLPKGVLCSRWFLGSPSHKYGIRSSDFIGEVNGIPTPNLEEFLKVIFSMPKEQRTVRLKVFGLEDKRKTVTYKMDEEYWPVIMFEVSKETNQWVVKTHKRQ